MTMFLTMVCYVLYLAGITLLSAWIGYVTGIAIGVGFTRARKLLRTQHPEGDDSGNNQTSS